MAGRPRKLYSDKGLTKDQLEQRELAMADLIAFVALVAPYRVLGHCHFDMMKFFMGNESHQLLLYPRAHQKSFLIACLAAWRIINNPAITILYATHTADLAVSQLNQIKQILNSDIARKYWPELLNETNNREKWSQDAISVDHWKRYEEGVRDYTVLAAGVGKATTGFHADLIIFDDIVVLENAITKTERSKLKTWASLIASVLNPGGEIKAIGTKYHPEDLYTDFQEMEEDIYDDDGNIVGKERVYKFDQKVVEVDGQFLWPRQKRKDGKWFGFNRTELAKKKAQYLDMAQFFAQYYMDASDPENKRISNFEYYDKSLLSFDGRYWSYKGRRLNVYAAIDFAATITKTADYTAIVVIGIDCDHNIFVLDIDRFKTDKISEMETHLTKLYDKWNWIKLRAETNAQQNLVVEQIKESNKKNGVFYTVDKIPSKGDKSIRIMSNLEPRYAQGAIFHFKGGDCELLEQELKSTKPPHDDISDAFASAVEIAIAPAKHRSMGNSTQSNVVYHPRFGGVA